MPVVSVVRIRSGRIEAAVEEAIELLGGMAAITRGKERVMLKPNLVAPVVEATANSRSCAPWCTCCEARTGTFASGRARPRLRRLSVRKRAYLPRVRQRPAQRPQRHVFDALGYTDFCDSRRVPLVNLHTGELAEVSVPGALLFDKLTLHRSLTEIDLLCSVPMMKTHVLAGVTLGMKNLIGVYPGAVYQALRGNMHDLAIKVEPSGTAAPIVDMVRANKLGLVVIDGSSAMEGNGPTGGTLVPMETIVAGTNPLATDMVAASLMGFEPEEISTFTWAHKAGMRPRRMEEIETRGEPLERVRRRFCAPGAAAVEPCRHSAAS